MVSSALENHPFVCCTEKIWELHFDLSPRVVSMSDLDLSFSAGFCLSEPTLVSQNVGASYEFQILVFCILATILLLFCKPLSPVEVAQMQ